MTACTCENAFDCECFKVGRRVNMHDGFMEKVMNEFMGETNQ